MSGETLKSSAPDPRVLLGLGATWRRGPTALHGALQADGLGTNDRNLAGRIDLRMAF